MIYRKVIKTYPFYKDITNLFTKNTYITHVYIHIIGIYVLLTSFFHLDLIEQDKSIERVDEKITAIITTTSEVLIGNSIVNKNLLPFD